MEIMEPGAESAWDRIGWLHGDGPGNLLVLDGRLSSVISLCWASATGVRLGPSVARGEPWRFVKPFPGRR
jgi:hypothetical protein